MNGNPLVSIVIPNYNGARTIGLCLSSIFSAIVENNLSGSFEVIVVDDCSTDNSSEIIRKFPCRFISLKQRVGASGARNIGARSACGEALFFIDADCMLTEHTLNEVLGSLSKMPDAIVGGTYTLIPYDRSFFSIFQSVSINYAETKRAEPDYIATHAMLINKELFLKSGGFREDFFPILEDVEFSHRLKRTGVRLVMNPLLLVRHIFNFNLMKSLKNAFRKSFYWTAYSIANGDLLRDSGTASVELKSNVLLSWICFLLILVAVVSDKTFLMMPVGVLFGINIFINRKLLDVMRKAGGIIFMVKSAIYYSTLYAFTVGAGSAMGALSHLMPAGRFGRRVPENR